MTNPLVAQQPESDDGLITKGTGDTGWASGIGIAESVNDVSSLNDGSHWVESGLAYGGLAMEGLSLAVDPIGTLLSYGLSWLIEHVQPLKEALDWFAGDPDGVRAYGQTWANVSEAVGEAAAEYNAAVKADTANWTGAAGDAYRKTAAEKGEALTGAAKLAESISSVVTIMGEVVSFVRELVRDLVADCISRLITYALEALLPPIASLAWVVPQAIAFISTTVTKIAEVVTKLIKTISNVSPKIAKLAEVFGDIMKVLGDKGRSASQGLAKVAHHLDVGERLAEKAWKKVDDTFGTDVVGRHNARFGGPDTPGTPDAGDGGSSSAQSGSTADSRSSADSPPAGGDSPGGPRGNGDSGSVREDPTSSGGQSGGDGPSGQARPESGSSHTDSNSGGSTPDSSGSSRADTAPGSSASSRADAGSAPDTGGTPRTDSGGSPRAEADPGGVPRPDSGTHSGPGQADSSPSGSGAGAQTSDVPRAPAHTSAASVEAPPRPPDAASPQSAPAARPDQPSSGQSGGGVGAPGGPSAPGNGTPSPRGGRPGTGGWSGTPGHPGAARNLPSQAPRTPDAPHARPDGRSPVHAGPAAPRQVPTPSARAHAPQVPVHRGAPVHQSSPVHRQHAAPPRQDHLRTADAPRTIPSQRAPEPPNSLPEQPKPDQPKVSTAESMAAETPPKDQWQEAYHRPTRTPRLDISEELREKLGPHRREIEATHAGLSFTKPDVRDYHGKAEWAHKRPRCSVDPNRFTVEMHGGPDGVRFKGLDLDAEELAEIIKGAPGYEEGTPIRLVSCETGADVPDGKNFAQQLSEELGVEVLAPNTKAWVDNHGNIYASETPAKFDQDDTGTPQPRLDSPGEWTAFRPDGTKAVHDSPYPPGHNPEWVRHGVQAEAAHMRGLFGRRKDEDFSIDPVTGHNYSNAPPRGVGAPQQHGGHPQQPQASPQHGTPAPHQQGYPQPYTAQNYGQPRQGFPQQPQAPFHPGHQQASPRSGQQHSPQLNPTHNGGHHPPQPQNAPQSSHRQAPRLDGYGPGTQPHPGGYAPPQAPSAQGAPQAHPFTQTPASASPPVSGAWMGHNTQPPAASRPQPMAAPQAPRSQPVQQPPGMPRGPQPPNTPSDGTRQGPPAQHTPGNRQAPRPSQPRTDTPRSQPNPRSPQGDPQAARSSAPAKPPAGKTREQGPAGPHPTPSTESVPARSQTPGPAWQSTPKPVRSEGSEVVSEASSARAAETPGATRSLADFDPITPETSTTPQAPSESGGHRAAVFNDFAPARRDFAPGPPKESAPDVPTDSSRGAYSAGSSSVDQSKADPRLSNRESWERLGVTPEHTERYHSCDASPDALAERPSKSLADFDDPGHVDEPVDTSRIGEMLAGSGHPSQGPEVDAPHEASQPPGLPVPDQHSDDAADVRVAGSDQAGPLDVVGEQSPSFRAAEADRQVYQERIERSRLHGRTFADAVAELRAKYPEMNHLPDVEAVSLRRYVGEDAITMNRALRTLDEIDLSYLSEEIKVLRSALNQMPDYSGSTAYRNIGVEPHELEALLDRYEPGANVVENGFTSASKDAPLDEFGKADGKQRVQFVIENPRWAKDLEFMNPDEREILWPDGNRFEVSKQYFDPESGEWKIHLIDHGRE